MLKHCIILVLLSRIQDRKLLVMYHKPLSTAVHMGRSGWSVSTAAHMGRSGWSVGTKSIGCFGNQAICWFYLAFLSYSLNQVAMSPLHLELVLLQVMLFWCVCQLTDDQENCLTDWSLLEPLAFSWVHRRRAPASGESEAIIYRNGQSQSMEQPWEKAEFCQAVTPWSWSSVRKLCLASENCKEVSFLLHFPFVSSFAYVKSNYLTNNNKKQKVNCVSPFLSLPLPLPPSLPALPSPPLFVPVFQNVLCS